jgi:hypothetical protein
VLLESNLNNYENKQVIFNVIKFFILSWVFFMALSSFYFRKIKE